MARSLAILQSARACTHCAGLPLGPRPLVAGTRKSSVLIIGQAPGLAAHESGIPWNDASGDRLREWLGLSREVFYDPEKVALMPMGFCYPGKAKTGDSPPRPECAPLWHDRILKALSGVKLTLLVGRFAFERYAKDELLDLTTAALSPDRLLPRKLVLPHPSPLNNRWLARNPRFKAKVLPIVKSAVEGVLSAEGHVSARSRPRLRGRRA